MPLHQCLRKERKFLMSETQDYRKKIDELLNQYENGHTVFKDAEDWDTPIAIKEDATMSNLPDSWLGLADRVISIIAHDKYNIDTYQNVLEVIDSEQMIDAYARAGMPVGYDHWSIGKGHVQQEKAYKAGQMGLAYEIVVNTDPSIAYLMTENSKTMQLLVIAHASYGHNSFFKGNHLFKQFTQADTIVDDLVVLKEKVEEAEIRYGYDAVEELLDACHALQMHGVNRHSKPKKRTPGEEKARRDQIEELRRQSYDPLLDSVRKTDEVVHDFKEAALRKELGFLDKGEENLLQYIAAYGPHLDDWQRDLIKRVSGVGQYFYPQRQTQVMNEGWASFWHYTIMTDLQDLDLIDSGMYMEFLQSHTSVLYQPDFDSPHYSGINPYALGFAVYQDIKRMCEKPTDEDHKYFPELAGQDWLETIKFAMENYKDESFIQQYLSPKVIRDFHLFSYTDDDTEQDIEISAIHNEAGYRDIPELLSAQYNLGNREACIEVVQYDYRGDMSIRLHHKVHDRKLLEQGNAQEVLKHFHTLWQKNVILESVDAEGNILDVFECSPENDFTTRQIQAASLVAGMK